MVAGSAYTDITGGLIQGGIFLNETGAGKKDHQKRVDDDDDDHQQGIAGSGLASYGWHSQQSQHVIYVGTDGNVWELYQLWEQFDEIRGGLLWQSNNLSQRTGYVGELAPKENSPLAGAMFETEGSEHVIYIAKDNTIRELWFYNGTWGGNNLTEATGGAVAPASNSALTVYAAEYEDTLHVAYLGVDGNIHELWWNRYGWQPDHPISQIVNVKPASDTAIIGYATEYEKTHHVVYINQNNELQELYQGMSRSVLKFPRQASLIGQAMRPWRAVQGRGFWRAWPDGRPERPAGSVIACGP